MKKIVSESIDASKLIAITGYIIKINDKTRKETV
jgi:hypothetical protein